MPSNVVKGFAEKTGKSEAEVEKLWDEAKAKAKEEYPDVTEDSDRFYMIVTGILKKMLGMNESFEDIINAEFQKLHEMEDNKKEEEDEEVDNEEEEDEEDKKDMKTSEEDENSKEDK